MLGEMQRRTWLQGWMLGTVQALTGFAWSRLLVSEVQAVQTGPGALYLQVADYPALQQNGGSIIVDLGEIVPPLIVTRAEANAFYALDSKCTHAGCIVGGYSAAQGFIQCPCHGSRYDIQGRVIRGPADQNLTSYAVFSDPSGELKILHPSLTLNAKPAQLLRRSPTSLRLRLTFRATASRRYRLHYLSAPGATSIQVPFAVQEHSSSTQQEFIATSDGLRHLYVDSSAKRGFFQVREVE